MKLILCLPLLFAAGLWADEAQDRAAIDQTIAALNDAAQRAELCTKDADPSQILDHLIDFHRANPPLLLAGRNETWTQLTVTHIVTGPIRFLAPISPSWMAPAPLNAR